MKYEHLYVKRADKNATFVYDIRPEHAVTLITGNSGTGKTLFFRLYKALHPNDVLLIDSSFYDVRESIPALIQKSKANWVFIDSFDLLCTQALDTFIAKDGGVNHLYLLAGRSVYQCTNGFLGLAGLQRGYNKEKNEYLITLDYMRKF